MSTPDPAISHRLDACQSELAGRTAQALQRPSDFRRDHQLSCDCQDCRTLSMFLADPNEEQLRLPLAKHRRQHPHYVIDRNRCDLTHVTERRGRPYTLVCTKTTASYETACKVHDRDVKHLKRLSQLMSAMKRQA